MRMSRNGPIHCIDTDGPRFRVRGKKVYTELMHRFLGIELEHCISWSASIGREVRKGGRAKRPEDAEEEN